MSNPDERPQPQPHAHTNTHAHTHNLPHKAQTIPPHSCKRSMTPSCARASQSTGAMRSSLRATHSASRSRQVRSRRAGRRAALRTCLARAPPAALTCAALLCARRTTTPLINTPAVPAAAAFCLDVQCRLLETSWPAGVLKMRSCRPVHSAQRGTAAPAASAQVCGSAGPCCLCHCRLLIPKARTLLPLPHVCPQTAKGTCSSGGPACAWACTGPKRAPSCTGSTT